MARGRTKNFERQINTVHMLAICPRQDCTVIEFKVDDCYDCVIVKRKYSPVHAKSLTYTEGFKVGPLGSIKRIYAHNNIA